MQTKKFIAVNEFCFNHKIEISFIDSLKQTGLIEFVVVEDKTFIHIDQLEKVEKYIRFYYDLDINLEGIETITHLLQRERAMQDEIIALRNRLSLYE